LRRVAGLITLGLGVFLLVLGLGVKFVVGPKLIKDPLTPPEKYSVIIAGGENFSLLDSSTLQNKNVTIRVTRTIQGDVAAGDSNVAVYDESLCLSVDDGSHPGCLPKSDPRSVLVQTDRIAFDRKTSLAVNDPKYNANVDGKPTKHEGLGYKFPIGTKKTTYPFFDTVVGKAFPMKYTSEEKIDGLPVYKFVQTITDQPVYTSNVLPSLYSNVRTVWVEPRTGVIIKGQEDLDQRLTGRENLDPRSPVVASALAGKTALKGVLKFDDQTVANQAQLARDNIPKLRLIQTVIPLVGIIGGAVLTVIGIVLLATGRKGPGDEASADTVTLPQSDTPPRHGELPEPVLGVPVGGPAPGDAPLG
jgi:hypothetical protein